MQRLEQFPPHPPSPDWSEIITTLNYTLRESILDQMSERHIATHDNSDHLRRLVTTWLTFQVDNEFNLLLYDSKPEICIKLCYYPIIKRLNRFAVISQDWRKS